MWCYSRGAYIWWQNRHGAETKRSVYILELKYKKDAEAAMEQIDSKDYLAAFADDSRKKYKVGINFSEDRRSIDDWKVEALA